MRVSSPHNVFWIPEGAVESVCAGCSVGLKQKFGGSLTLGRSCDSAASRKIRSVSTVTRQDEGRQSVM